MAGVEMVEDNCGLWPKGAGLRGESLRENDGLLL